MVGTSEATLRAKILAELPPEALVRRPLRILLAIPLIAVIVGTSLLLVRADLPWYGTLLAWAVLSNAYAALMFFGHEMCHGAVTRSERLQNAVLVASLAIFVVSPHLWRHWHNRLHHGHTNIPGIDPDRYDLLDEFRQSHPLLQWLTGRLAPGSGHWLSAFYLFIAFTAHAQSVLWYYSRRHAHSGFRWKRAVGETIVPVVFWLALAVAVGPRGALTIIIVPMLLANAIVMAYITTNHMLRPLTDTLDALSTSLSVTTPRVIDMVHLHFSHHIEHHLFPSLSHRYYPLVRRSLRRHAGDSYSAPTHWRALLALYRTPRHYADYHTLIDPLTGKQVALAAVEDRLRRADPQRRMGTAA